MDSRRDFLKKAALLSGATMMWRIPESIERAAAITVEAGSSYLDAEHVVILMQENRSFDHCLGTLNGVRGFNDPHPHLKPNLEPVWLQEDKSDRTYGPFRLDINRTNITWLGGLPHSWGDQVEAGNEGRYDQWLIYKTSGYEPLADKPMTMGHYTREDIPFYYAMADAFTVCDQYFCSSLTGTTPNRLYLWTGTIRNEKKATARAHVENEEADHDHEVEWGTFPERLEKAGISWKVYQNELDIDSGLTGEEDTWLGCFSDNPLEFFKQYRVRFSPRRRAFVQQRISTLKGDIESLKNAASDEKSKAKLTDKQNELSAFEEEAAAYTDEAWNALPDSEKAIHANALVCNTSDPDYRELEELEFDDNGTKRKIKVPKGDVFHQFRKDVESGQLPTVSWLVGPEHFSDHPSSAWFGAWYVSEALDILTKNPEIWKKTIFILNYDENDGYFDHIPPFGVPNPYQENSGKVSEGLEPELEFVTKEQSLKYRPGYHPHDSTIGLGYRVPMIIASPWNRGGMVSSEVFDHTSVIQFLEHFLSAKTGQKVEEPNITSWRRAVCGDLTSTFRVGGQPEGKNPESLDRNKHIERIDKARYKEIPSGFKEVSKEEIAQYKNSSKEAAFMPHQEQGGRNSSPLPYQISANSNVSSDGNHIQIELGCESIGPKHKVHATPLNVYAYGENSQFQARVYAVREGDRIQDSWDLDWFGSEGYRLRAYGPNGFFREFAGSPESSQVQVSVQYRPKKNFESAVLVQLANGSQGQLTFEVTDCAYGADPVTATLPPGKSKSINIGTAQGKGWYDFKVTCKEFPNFLRHYAGRVETGDWGVTDPSLD